MPSWQRHTKGNKQCPVCHGQRDDCRTNQTTGIHHCRAGYEGWPPLGLAFLDYDEHGFAKFCAEERHAKLTGTGKRRPLPPELREPRLPIGPAPRPTDPAEVNTSSARVLRGILADRKPLPPELLARLAAQICLPIEAFFAVPMYHCRAWGHEWLAYLLRNGEGKLTGGKLRPLSGDKLTLVSPGLVYRDDVAALGDTTAPIYFPEGWSDFAALTHLGLAAVARDSATHGAADIVALVRRLNVPADRPLVILGEFDEHVNKAGATIWPGRDGAFAVAQAVATALGRPVHVAFPPDNAKDVREWYCRTWLDRQPATSQLSADEMFVADPAWQLGRYWIDRTLSTATAVMPQERQPADPLPDGLPIEQTPLVNPFVGEFANLGTDGASLAPGIAPSSLPLHLHACPHCVQKLMHNKSQGVAGLFRFSCHRLSCPACGERYRQTWLEAVSVRLAQHDRDTDGASVFVFLASRDDWQRWVYRRIREADGQFIRIDPGNGDLCLVVSSVRPAWPTAGAIDEMTPTDAAARVSAAVRAVLNLHRKVYFSSHRWKLLDVAKPLPKGWSEVGRYEAADTIEDSVLRYHRLAWKRSRSGRSIWPRSMKLFALRPDIDLDHLLSDLQVGEPSQQPEPHADDGELVAAGEPGEWNLNFSP